MPYTDTAPFSDTLSEMPLLVRALSASFSALSFANSALSSSSVDMGQGEYPRSMAPRTCALLTVALLLAGCETTAEVIEKKQEPVRKVFTALPTSGFIDPLEPPTAVQSADPPIVLEGPGANAMFVYAEDLKQLLKAPSAVALRTIDSLPLIQCVSLLETGHLFNDTITRVSPSLASGYLDACARLKYALVIRVRSYTRPELQLETRQFAPGRYEADVYVVSLEGKLLGGFHVSATNDSRVSLLDGDQNHLQRLIGNLEATTFDALRAEAKKAIPGVLP